MKSFTLASAIAYAGGVSAFWRMPCRSVTGYGRIDPIVDPGSISAHVHAIHGSGAFGQSSTFETLTADGTCTSCEVVQDKSAYWTPALYFQYKNGTTVMVPQIGGMLAYYLQLLDDVKAFPEGFQMLAGNKDTRNFTGEFPDSPLASWPSNPTDQFFLQQRALGFNCLNYSPGSNTEPSLYRHEFPQKDFMDANCLDGLRLELGFPSCGKKGELDSPDHQSHVAYPNLVKQGNCPEGFDVHYPFLFFETIWATNVFAGVDGDFLLSNGDPTGASYHGDFQMGWDSADFLQEAVDKCTSPSGKVSDCPLFTTQSDAEAQQCTFETPSELADDDCHGPRQGLPVGVPVQWGPEPATEYNVAGVNGVPTTPVKQSSAPAKETAAKPEVTSQALGDIVVAAEDTAAKALAGIIDTPEDAAPTTAMTVAPTTTLTVAAEVTPAPIQAAVESDANKLSTTWITKGYQVIELVIEQAEVTVTATASAQTPAPYKHRRHLERHQHHHHMH